jgi:hypothetical protein
MMSEKASPEIVNFIKPVVIFLKKNKPVLGRYHFGHIVKMHYSFENPLLYSNAETQYVKVMARKPLTDCISRFLVCRMKREYNFCTYKLLFETHIYAVSIFVVQIPTDFP